MTDHPSLPRVVPADASGIAEAVALLQAGQPVAFPTETVYGLGANALNPAAVARIYAAKGRPAYNPMIVHVADVTAARALARAW
ncbi:MAG TPA: Sua5/YciO/YrdC/YwlC family protein, partial [Gemmatimonadales bacterium]|nr:Sua5/YciO/YrdC/YwlC family protein [Gemmatimonadales bacterium]